MTSRTCENPYCENIITEASEFVYQRTTRHERWFCSTECLIESREEARWVFIMEREGRDGIAT